MGNWLPSSYKSLDRDFSVDEAPFTSQILKIRHLPNVQLCMLYLTSKTMHLYLFKRLSHLSLIMTFSGFFLTPPHLEAEMEMKMVECFYPDWCARLLDGCGILCAKPEDPQLKTLYVIHKRHRHRPT
jgi:hypothetical protein